jgi:hypothetical protein
VKPATISRRAVPLPLERDSAVVGARGLRFQTQREPAVAWTSPTNEGVAGLDLPTPGFCRPATTVTASADKPGTRLSGPGRYTLSAKAAEETCTPESPAITKDRLEVRSYDDVWTVPARLPGGSKFGSMLRATLQRSRTEFHHYPLKSCHVPRRLGRSWRRFCTWTQRSNWCNILNWRTPPGIRAIQLTPSWKNGQS